MNAWNDTPDVVAGVSYSWMVENMKREDEPLWLRTLRTLRAVKRATGLTWEEILGR